MNRTRLIQISECLSIKPGYIPQGEIGRAQVGFWLAALAHAPRVMNEIGLLFPSATRRLEIRWASSEEFALTLKKFRGDYGYRACEMGLYVGEVKPYALIHHREGVPHKVVVAHEIGHYVDNVLLGGISSGRSGAWSSEDDALLNGWRAAIQATWAVSELKNIVSGKLVKASQSMEYATYLLRPEELFARSFAQYVGTKSQDATLLEELAPGMAEDGPFSCSQWQPSDFHLVLNSFDDLFLALKGRYAAEHGD